MRLDQTTTWQRVGRNPSGRNPSGQDPSPDPLADEPAKDRGTWIGRYLLIRRIGQGGLGVIYSAYDPELDRKVALKLLKQPGGRGGRDGGHGRLAREARALARLTHPNVISVHDAGTFDDQVFIAMELVRGRTLTDWLVGERPAWRAILEAFRQAGEGLAAAHQAGLLHRDFKPANVMLGDDGRVRVLDFGLARYMEQGEDSDSGFGRLLSSLSPAGQARELTTDVLTRTGTRMGTPAYMAPEQIQGAEIDARTDQFNFCVALHEALLGELPFRGESWDEYSARVCRGETSEVTSTRGVPAWLRGVLSRGLSPNPEARYPSMSDLLEDLDRHPRRRKRVLTGLGAGVLATLFLVTWQAGRPSLCQGAENKLIDIWDAPRRDRLKSTFLATRLPYAEQTWLSSQQILDDYAASWTEMYTDTCEATHRRGEQSEALLDLRMQCLEGRLKDLAATTDLLVDADSGRVRHAVNAASKLPPLAACSNVDRLRFVLKPPESKSAHLEVERLRLRIARGRALRQAGQHRETLPLAHQLANASLDTEYEPLMAEAHHLLGRSLMDNSDFPAAAEALVKAGAWALQGRHDEIRGRILLDLVWVLGDRLRQTEEGERWLTLARGAVAQGPRPESLASADPADWSQAAAVLYLAKQDLDRALSEARAAVRGKKAAAGTVAAGTVAAGTPRGEAVFALSTLARVLYHQGNFEEALVNVREVEDIQRRRLGAAHPDTLLVSQNIGEILSRLGRHPEAMDRLEKSLEVTTSSFGPDSAEAATVLTSLGNVQWRMSRLEEARESHSRALGIRRAVFGESHARVAQSLKNLAIVLRDLGRRGQAEEFLRKALEIHHEVDGPDHKSSISVQRLLDKLRRGEIP